MFEEQVAKGAAFLDKWRPGWARMIDVETLDISSCSRCVCGQLAGEAAARNGLQINRDRMVELGFMLSVEEMLAKGFSSIERPFRELRKTWISEISHRRGVATMLADVSEPKESELVPA